MDVTLAIEVNGGGGLGCGMEASIIGEEIPKHEGGGILSMLVKSKVMSCRKGRDTIGQV